MTRDFQILMGRFQEIQRLSLEKCQDFVIRAQAIAHNSTKTSPNNTEESLESEEEEPLVSRFPSIVPICNMFREQQQRQDLLGLENEISYNQALIQEREQGIQEIESAMAEVHELFCDIGLLVGEQQGVLGTPIICQLNL